MRQAENKASLLARHAHALWYVLGSILPTILRTGTRPVIFSKYAGVGDILCTFPAALELRKRHPKARFIYNCAASSACLPRMGGVADQVTTSPHIGLVEYWYRFLLSGFYGFSSDDDNPEVAASESYIRGTARRQGVAVGEHHPRLEVDAAIRARVQALLTSRGIKSGPLILLHPGPTWAVKQWPAESWVELVRQLKEQGYGQVVQLGAGSASYTNLGHGNAPVIEGAVSLVDQLSLEESVALISLADLFIGVDSGLLHVAACLRTPAVGLWGPTSPGFIFSKEEARWFVTSTMECQGCHHRAPRLHWMTGCPHEIRCMKKINVGEVIEACLMGLEQEKCDNSRPVGKP